jgi:iron complex transport system permease protein
MVAAAVSACGQIGWVGLVIPHMVRTWVGPDHRVMIPVTILMGAAFLLSADIAARSLTAAELPVSILTALIGGPVFAILLYRNRARGWM